MVIIIGNSFADEPYRHPSADALAARNKRGPLKHKTAWRGSWQWDWKPSRSIQQPHKRGSYRHFRSGADIRRQEKPY